MTTNNKQLIYLASPHSHTSSAVREDRYKEALKCTSWLVDHGFWVYSSIVSNHNLGLQGNIDWHDSKVGWEYWQEFDTEMIKRCDELWVLQIMEATKYSVGVRAEVKIAQGLGKPVYSIWQDPNKSYSCYLNCSCDGMTVERIVSLE